VGEQGAGAGDFGGVGAVLLRDAGFGGADVCWGLLVGACIDFGESFFSEWMLLGGGLEWMEWGAVAKERGDARLIEERMTRLTIPVRTLGAEEFEDVDAAAAVGGLEDYWRCVSVRNTIVEKHPKSFETKSEN